MLGAPGVHPENPTRTPRVSASGMSTVFLITSVRLAGHGKARRGQLTRQQPFGESGQGLLSAMQPVCGVASSNWPQLFCLEVVSEVNAIVALQVNRTVDHIDDAQWTGAL